MKNTVYLLLLCAVVSLIGCQKDNLDVQPETEIERSSDRRKKKVKVCHCTGSNGGQDWKVIKVSKNALRGHLRHGDFKMKDKDGDGFYQDNPCVPADQVDCDDWNYYANPNSPEDPTNGIDDNCDGEIDEGGTVDADGDGFDSDADCNDDDANVYPGATEITYNGIDDDCDDLTIDAPCNLFEELDIVNLTPIFPAGVNDALYGFSTTNGVETVQIAVLIVGDNYGLLGSLYNNNGDLISYAPLSIVIDELFSSEFGGQFDSLDQAQECMDYFANLIASLAP